MITHASETKALWDAFDPAVFGLMPKTDNKEEPIEPLSDSHELSELCPVCDEGFIGPNGCSNGCDD